MYPILFEIFGYPVASFGVMMALGFLVGTWITAVRLEEYGRDPDLARRILPWGVVGGLLGSKLYFAVDVALRTGEPFLALLLSREGITWYGGLGMALAAVACRRYGLPMRVFWNSVCIAACVAQALGRVGCFLNGDDYGRATELPWGIAFPQGVPPTTGPVHPTQLYEMAWLLLVAGFLWLRRKRSPFLAGETLMLTGAGRFAIEELRLNPPVAFGLTEPQIIGASVFVIGALTWLYYRAQPGPHGAEPAAGEATAG
jgi:phosphatidylglycerol:prolipoprotein diacylglycerol transferase